MKLAVIGFVALLSLPFASLAQSADGLDGRLKTIRDSGSIGVAYRTDAPPFSFEDNKQVTGYTIDLCRRVVAAIERQLGIGELKIRWVPVNGQTRFEAIAKGEADMECGSSTVTLSRLKTVDFSSFTFIDSTRSPNGGSESNDCCAIGAPSNERASEPGREPSAPAAIPTRISAVSPLTTARGASIDATATSRRG